ncbi:MAG: glycosyltransferase family 2 protein [Bacteroidia bacterium]
MNESKPLVSVITVSYNAMPYIQETIRSVADQDYDNIEHIVIDGASTDGTKEFLETCSNITWISEKDNGQSEALNKGFRLAKGEIIGWLNADDTYQPDAVSSAVELFSANLHVDILHGDLNIIDRNSKLIGKTKGDVFILNKLIVDTMIKQPTVFIRRNVIESLNGVNEKYHFVMDRELWLRAGLRNFRFKYVSSKIEANFRLCEGTKTHDNTIQFRLEWLDVLNNLSENEINKIGRKNLLYGRKKTITGLNMAYLMNAIDSKSKKTKIYQIYKSIKHDMSLFINLGFWRYAIAGLLGKPINKYRRFEKQL